MINPLKSPVTIDVIETLSCSLNKDGGMNSFKIVGEVILMFYDPSKASATI